MNVRGAVAGAGSRGAVVWVPVVADPLDRRFQRAGGPGAGAAAGAYPAELVREPPGRGVPVALGRAGRGDQVDGRAVAVGVMTGFAGGDDPQLVAVNNPEDVVVDTGVH